jgi:WD40 repeat protein
MNSSPEAALFQLALAKPADNRSLRIWNIVAGAEEIVLCTNSPGPIRRPEFSADGKRLAVAEEGRKTRVWNTADWSSESLDDSVSTNVGRLVFSLNGSRLIQSVRPGNAGEGEVLDLASGKNLLRVQEDRALGLVLSPDGTLLAVGTQDDRIHLRNVERGQQIGTLRGHVQGVMGVSFSPDGKPLASCADSRVKLWNVETQQEILTFDGLDSPSNAFLFSSDGSCLAARVRDDRVGLWRTPSFQEIAATEANENAESKQP